MSNQEANPDLEKGPLEAMASPSPILNRSSVCSVSEHIFQVHNYKRPTFCAHCGSLLVGVVKQGLRCKRCQVDVHDKCQEDLKKECIEVIVGHHNFREKTYKHLTYCNYCEKLLVGVVNQGLKCSECGLNVHDKCQEKIEVACEKSQHRRRSSAKSMEETSSRPSMQRGRRSRISKRTKPNEKTPLQPMGRLSEENSEQSSTDHSRMFDTMPEPSHSRSHLSPSSVPSSPKQTRKQMRSKSLGPDAETLRKQVNDVTNVMSKNVGMLNQRGEKLENLEMKSQQLEESSKIFETKTKDIKKKYWLKDKKMWIGIAVAVTILIIIIIIVIVVKTLPHSQKSPSLKGLNQKQISKLLD